MKPASPNDPPRPSVSPPPGATPSVAPSRAPTSMAHIPPRRPSQRAMRAVTTASEGPKKRLRLGDVLLEAKLVTPAQIESALAQAQRQPGARIGEILVRSGALSELALTQALGRKFSMPVVDLDQTPADPNAWPEAPLEVMQRKPFLPLASDSRAVRVAIADPLNAELTDLLRFHLGGRQLQEVLAMPSQLARHVARHLQARQSVVATQRMDAILKELSIEIVADENEGDDDALMDSDSAVIKLVNQMILDAWQRNASDIHIEPRGSDAPLLVRFRIDGECVPYQQVPAAYRAPLVSRLKIIAGLDIAERRKPQDGKIRFSLGSRALELRVATIPTSHGSEDVVLRLLTNAKASHLEDLALSHRNLAELKRLMTNAYGLMLCAGPTGSGKTTTLHAMLASLNTPNVKIWTAEDPIEITQEGLRQVQTQPKVGFTFAAALRAFLRADPDVIMVGEMRDRETAGIAIEASLTGHLVLSTLHTNTAPETVTRLLEMGIDPFAFGDALLGVIAQRLVRRLCASCRAPRSILPDEREWMTATLGGAERVQALLHRPPSKLELWQAAGCEECAFSGYDDRLALHELLVVTEDLRHAIVGHAPIAEIRKLANDGGMTTLLQDGIAKAVAGETDLRQVKTACSR